MVVLVHVLIALSSIAATTALFFRPSRQKLQGNYALMALTLISGTYLTVSTHAHLLEACATGLVYISGVSFGTVLGRNKLLARERS